MQQHAPGIARVEPFHEFGRARWVQGRAEFAQLERIVFGQHLAQFRQEQRVDHGPLAP
jgi:hypothetical protein